MRFSCPSPRGWWAALACVLGLLGCAQPQARPLTLFTWNVEWLVAPKDEAELRARCVPRQPRSDERALPCTPGRKPPPSRQPADHDALARTAQHLLADHHADVVALQEVDGPAAARTVFRKGWVLDCFVKRAHPQGVGFAIREGVPYRCNGDLDRLDTDGATRSGADVTLFPGTLHEVRLLAVHLKSGCFDGRLDRAAPPCRHLRDQVPVLEEWVDARVRERVAFAVLGDFNRHLERDGRYPAGDDEAAPLNMVAALSDDRPAGAILTPITQGQSYVPCDRADRHDLYIDDVMVSQRLASRSRGQRFLRVPFGRDDEGRQLSDHCPVGVRLDGAAP